MGTPLFFEEKSQFVFLPSDASKTIYPENQPTDFRVRLPMKIINEGLM